MADEPNTQTQTPGGGGTPGGQQTPAAQEPFWNTLPENMRGATAEDTLKKLMPSWDGYHKAHTSREPVLTKPEDFTLEITSDKVKPFFDPKSPLASAFAKAAVDAGLTKTAASKVGNSVMSILAEGGHLAEAFDPVKTVTAIAKVLGHAEMNDAAKTAVQQFETESIAWAANTAQQWKLSEAGQAELESLALTPGGVEILKAMRAQDGQGGFKLGGGGAGDGQFYSKEELHRMDSDPRIDPRKFDKFDKAVRAKYDASYAHHYSGRG